MLTADTAAVRIAELRPIPDEGAARLRVSQTWIDANPSAVSVVGVSERGVGRINGHQTRTCTAGENEVT